MLNPRAKISYVGIAKDETSYLDCIQAISDDALRIHRHGIL